MRCRLALVAVGILGLLISCAGDAPADDVALARPTADDRTVGEDGRGGRLVQTGLHVLASGPTLDSFKRPLDLAATGDGRFVWVKDDDDLVLVDAATFAVATKLPYGGDGSSQHGIVASADGLRALVTGAKNALREATLDGGKAAWGRRIELKTADGKDAAPLGVAASKEPHVAWVCLSRENALAKVDLAQGKVVARIAVGVCPWGVVVDAEERFAYVTCFGGRRAKDGERTAKSAGTDVVVDERGLPVAGLLVRVDLAAGAVVASAETGLHPSAVALAPDGARLYVACAGADAVEVFDAAGPADALRRAAVVDVKLDARLPYGAIPDGLSVAPDGAALYVACSGQNAVAVVATPQGAAPAVRGFLPTNFRPGALAATRDALFVADLRGVGAQRPDDRKAFTSSRTIGTVTKVARPGPSTDLAGKTATARENARTPRALAENAASRPNAKPVPVPKAGEPSTIEHVIYVIKENRTYDQIFGALGVGNGEPSLCIYGRDVTPNHHALARRYVLLDNYYCNGVVSADGHGWATQGITANYVEKGFGGWARSYDLGTDALGYAACDFLWDSVLYRGLSFRNYGEFDFPTIEAPKGSWFDVHAAWKKGGGALRTKGSIQNARLRAFSCPDFPGWEMKIPDQVRADAFLREFAEAEKSGVFPHLTIVYLPQDHTSGANKNAPSPRAHVADNDFALGRVVEAVSKSRFWPKTAIFVTEDDPQDGWDHVDGHRSLCLVISPWSKRGAVVSKFYNQTSVLRTIGRILGLPPLNAVEAAAPTMEDCFATTADPASYAALRSEIPFDEPNAPKAGALERAKPDLYAKAIAMRFDIPDRVDDDVMNRVLWHLAKGPETPYPAEWAGAHGRGLAALGLKFDPDGDEDDDGE